MRDARLQGWLVVALLLGTAVYAVAEEITLTTYYPSPRGVYQELRTLGNSWFGDISGNPPAARLRVTGDGTVTPFRVDDSGSTDTTPFVIDPAGNVGIGTTEPRAGVKLDVVGGDVCTDQGGGTCLSLTRGFGHFRVYPADNTFTPSTDCGGCTTVMVEVWGGGGGGSCGSSVWSGGGGGGGWGQGIFSVTRNTPYAVTVGDGGRGGTCDAVVNFNGRQGGTSRFGDFIEATGGGGGNYGNGNSRGGAGGSGSSPAGIEIISVDGARGMDGGYAAPNGGEAGGPGGSGGTPDFPPLPATPTNAGYPPGGGGASGYPGYPGGDGAPGRVIVWW